MRRPTISTAGGLVALLGVIAGCSTDGATGPVETTQFSQVLSLHQFDSTLGSGAHRVEIKLVSGSLTVREVDLEPDDAEEQIASEVTAIDPAQGTVTLALGGFKVSYNGNTRFRTPTRSRVSRSEWETAISAALNAGQSPPIEARRLATRDHQPEPAGPTHPGWRAHRFGGVSGERELG